MKTTPLEPGKKAVLEAAEWAGKQVEVETIKGAIKANMGGSDVLLAGEYKITWKAVESRRLDTAALSKALPELAAQFTKTTTVRRFCIA